MRKKAVSAGFYDSPWGKHGRLQLLTIEDLLTSRGIDRPPTQTSTTFKRAPKAAGKASKTGPLNFEKPDPDQPF
jgi:site-specific DNA-methyltransferase (adenine-specific)